MEVLQDVLDNCIPVLTTAHRRGHSAREHPAGGDVWRMRLGAVWVCMMVHMETPGDNPRCCSSGASHLLSQSGSPIGLVLHQLGQAKRSVGSSVSLFLFLYGFWDTQLRSLRLQATELPLMF